MTGVLIALEGVDASGKSTQARLLATDLGAVLTREPGGTAVGERIRELFLDPATRDLDPRAEALLVAAARAQHVAEVIRPALLAGEIVVSDRYIPSSLAYQAYGRGLPLDEVRELSGWATGNLWPDLVVLLDVPLEVVARRRGAPLDRVEAEDDGFHERVLAGYRALAQADPDRWAVVDGVGTVGEVASRVRRVVIDRVPHSSNVGGIRTDRRV